VFLKRLVGQSPNLLSMRTQRLICLLALALILPFLQGCNHARSSETEIVGSTRFSAQVHQALILLKTQDPDAYAIVTNYVGRIEEGKISGMWAYKDPPTYEMSDLTAFSSVTWCAATIAHDSFH